MKLIRAFLLLCSLFCGTASAWAAPVVLENIPQGQSLSASGQLLWLTDEGGRLAPEAVRDPAFAARFVPAPHPPRPGSNALPHWFKVELEQRGESGDWVLATQSTALKDVRFYGPFDASGQVLAPPVHTGLSQPFATRPLGSERYLLRLQLPGPGTYTVYARMVSGTTSNLDLSVWDATTYLQWRQHKRLFDGICYGILLALLVYNLGLAGIFRDRSYGLYVGQCLFALLTLASFNGHAAHYLWGDWPWWQEAGNVVLPSLWMLCSVLFARNFLDAWTVRWLNWMLLATGAVAAFTGVLGLSGQFGIAQSLNELTASVGSLTALVAALVMVRRGFKPARWYLAGQALLLFLVLGVVLVNWEVIDAPFLLANGLQIGVAAEMVVFALALSRRISGMQASQIKLRLQAQHLAEAAATDPLTGLYNRTGLAQQATQVLSSGSAHALMLLDLDRFKPINDTHGHDAGDAVLRAVADRLRAHTRAGDVAARLGGDEFVLLLGAKMSEAQLEALAGQLNHALRQPVSFQGERLIVGVSIGIARGPQDGHALTDLIRCADQAMYQAKQAHSGYAFFLRESSAT